MKIYRELKQGTEEWLQLRRGRLTASHAQAIATAGKGLDTLCYQKVAEKLTDGQGEGYTNADMERGNELEHEARSLYEISTGNIVEEVAFVELDEMIGCSPDGLIGDDGLIEIKCKNNVNHLKSLLSGEIEKAHYWQMQMQMYVTGRKWCDYVLYNPNYSDDKRLVIKRVERSDEDIEKIKIGLEKGVKLVQEIESKLIKG